MSQTSNPLRILGLETSEERVLAHLLGRESQLVSDIAKGVGCKRTSLYPILTRLQKRGMVRNVRIGKRTAWKADSLSKLRASCKHVEHELARLCGEEQSVAVVGIEASDIGIRVYRGKKQLLAAYEHMLTLSKAERVYAVQGNPSADLVLEKLDRTTIEILHEKFRKSGVIMEGINGQHVLELFTSLPLDFIESHRTRAVVSTLLPDTYMNFAIDVFVMRDTVLFVNVKDETVVHIQNKPITSFFYSWCTYVKDTGTTANMNEYLLRLIDEKK